MKPRPFGYIRPDSVEEALALLAEYGEDARVLAGGQSLVPMLNLRIVEAAALIDISRLAALDAIEDRGNAIEIGAAVTQNKLLAWPQLAEKLPLVAAALPHVGHFQTRNKGDRKSTRLNSSHPSISYAVFCLKKKNKTDR